MASAGLLRAISSGIRRESLPTLCFIAFALMRRPAARKFLGIRLGYRDSRARKNKNWFWYPINKYR